MRLGTSDNGTKAARRRKRYVFWLDILKDDEYVLAGEIEYLKQERGFAPALRDGLRLILSLRRGEFDVLYELFPGIVDRVKNDLLQGAFDIIYQMADEQRALRREVEALRKLVGSQSMQAPTTNAAQPPKAQVVKKASNGGNAAKNLLKGMMGL